MYRSAQHISWSILIRRYERPSMYKTITEHYTAYNNEQWYLKHYFIARDQSEHNVKQEKKEKKTTMDKFMLIMVCLSHCFSIWRISQILNVERWNL